MQKNETVTEEVNQIFREKITVSTKNFQKQNFFIGYIGLSVLRQKEATLKVF